VESRSAHHTTDFNKIRKKKHIKNKDLKT